MKVDFSIIIPLAGDAPKDKLFNCLKHLSKQKYPPKEIIVITGTDFNKRLVNRVRFLDKKIKVFRIDLNKAEARNFGSSKAEAAYVVNIDVDNYLDSDALLSAHQIIKGRHAKAIIIHEKVKPTNLISRIRCLEKKLCFYDPIGATPQVVEKKLFNKIGGFDEASPILDEYTLRYKLKKLNIKFCEVKPKISIDVHTNLKTILIRKYLRGRAYMQLKTGYPESERIFSLKRFSAFTKNLKIYLEDPVATVFYFIFKPIEWLVFILGVINPIYTKPYELESNAKTYDKIRANTNFRIYKNYSEYKLLEQLLSKDIKTVLEIGAGTGRITKFMTNKGLKVVPYDPSDAMIAEYRKKTGIASHSQSQWRRFKGKTQNF
jgi:glycosyltransferase involved in cell wall biosynthesis